MDSSDVIDKFKNSFKEESIENISDIEQALLNLEVSSDQDIVNSIFRNLHTIKGSSGMFGFNFTASLVHEIETVLDVVKNGKAAFNQAAIDATLMSVDFIRELIEGDEVISEIDFDKRKQFLVNEIRKVLDISNDVKGAFQEALENDFSKSDNSSVLEESVKVNSENKFDDEALQSEFKSYKILFSPAKGILFHGHKPINLLSKLINLGSGYVRAKVDNIPDLELISPDNVYVDWEIRLDTEESRESIEDIFTFLDSQSKIDIQELDKCLEANEGDNVESKNFNLLHLDRNSKDLTNSSFEKSAFVGKSFFNGDKNRSNIQDDTARSKVNIASIKVDSKKLDHLVNLVGELVTIQSKLSKEAENRNSNILNSISAEFSLLINELRDYTTGLRTVPIEILFVKFQRIVKDLSTSLGKSILYHASGGDTVLDKSIIEKLNEPLVHLIRNSIDHGIESAQERESLGKDPKGIIKLSACQSGDSVIVIIEDDGRGLDKNKILKKAIERNIISDSVAKTLSEIDVYNLIFEPGFSTASSVTDISGRGVGMDVVKKQVESLRGHVVLESEFGKYTRIKLIFPLTLAIIEGWLVRVKDEHFIVPLSNVESCLESNKLISQIDGIETKSNVMNYRGSMISYIRLREFFQVSSEKSLSEQVVVVNTNSGKMGIVVDEVLGQHQTVIKALGKIYSRVEGVSGATILGDGSLALVVDIDAITKLIK
ncbi:chemotaxis protein CheA [Borreliella burgdorferi]|uniref:Chemotaxis protein CheA n=1 Tax=Borreliella burgdorferi (strain ATCC 35210 / DSM 4680 / CIP 102532 / B31) TaxID=224326 RepID=O51515_BORBU|nr:chemotaxis protein CheA [Borreliella burgdorferi]AGS66568.1 chemotaxis protein CheA [Borreliella burgdorferi CA382]AAC66935.1 chemotaxis histidine kinase [Borreliella burgdorferi B31]ARS30317.1 chemotaxis protein CheA [Borreliella burgdorferi]ARS31548.1 chemotaxis protein CheA [Borreliella burgdorferi]ARS33295.1 chemotaxis protein CheA [Borreliella burgdorferi]